MKKNILISYVVDVDTDLDAYFALQKSLRSLPDVELAKFDAFEILDVKENN
jgi:hypothetical protein